MKMKSKFHRYLMMPLILAGISVGWQAQAETIDFEGLQEGMIVYTVSGDMGSGPINIFGFNGDFPAQNTAIIYDSDCPGFAPFECSGDDFDLGTPNELWGGLGIGAGGEGGAFVNDTAQGNLLIIAERLTDVLPGPGDGLVDNPDDSTNTDSVISFDFTALYVVTIESITLVDVEAIESPAVVTLFDKDDLQIGGQIFLPQTGDNGLAVDITLGPTEGVRFMEVELKGSGAIDNIVFTPGQGCTPGYWKQRHHFDSWVNYDPDDNFPAIFGEGPDKTLLKVLKTNGNKTGLEALGRHTVAALLNAESGDVNYPMTTAEVIAAFNAVYPGSKSDYNALKNQFAGLNELGCPLN